MTVEERQVGRTRFEQLELDAATVASQPALIDRSPARADPDLVLDVRLVGVRPDELDLDIDEIEAPLAPSFLKVRVRDVSMPALTEGPLPSPDTIAGAFIRDLEARIAELEAAGSRPPRPPSCATRSGSAGCCSPATRSRCEDPPAPAVADFRRYRDLDIELAPGLTVVRGPNEAGKSTIQRAIELALTRRVTSAAGDLEALRPWDAPRRRAVGRHHRVRAGRGGRPARPAPSRRRSPARRARSSSTTTASPSPTRRWPTRSWPS